ncbi:MAG: hypothetical protein EOP48_25785 [Sphingobacteriales bacterium]|nr:MAG: hypothetical protein EOP48_25785 [Sphingobacteriales bacterium]
MDANLSGEASHPDKDDRLKNAMNKLNFDPLHPAWGMATLAFRLWGLHYGIKYDLPPVANDYKIMFEETVNKVRSTKL